MSITCPDCHAELEPQNGVAHCEHCHKDIQLEARCPECHLPLQVLKACGAVDYFC
ncbi:TPA: zinc ribbon domain-containing protein, partial [Citrobacter freundii]|nr:zinc ribbon domain-containing protein [Citrobacter freundii]